MSWVSTDRKGGIMPSPYQPIEIGDTTFEAFELLEIGKELAGSEAFRKSGRVARTLVRGEAMTVVLTTVAAGTEIHEHNSIGPVLISVLSGSIRVSVAAEKAERNLSDGSAAVLSPNCAHRVVAERDSVFLIVFGGKSPSMGRR
jgi:quercetin dioxygenase-like cupin family protein